MKTAAQGQRKKDCNGTLTTTVLSNYTSSDNSKAVHKSLSMKRPHLGRSQWLPVIIFMHCSHLVKIIKTIANCFIMMVE